MNKAKPNTKKITPISNNVSLGASFSLHRCSELSLEPKLVLKKAITELGIKHFRIMSYWNIHEPSKGMYDWHELDWQLDIIEKYGATASLCVGKRQPRWPECHLPDWVNPNDRQEWYESLDKFIAATITRYKKRTSIVSYQLENEALLKSFGYCKDGDYSKKRLRSEFNLVKKLDPKRPIIMTLSDSWGLPWSQPNPDVYGMTLYPVHSDGKGNYSHSKRPAWAFQFRGFLIHLIWRKPLFIHELQAEPWLDTAILEAEVDTQTKLMNSDILLKNIAFAYATKAEHIDLWGLEWWYWLKYSAKKAELWDTIKRLNEKSSKKYPYETNL